MAGAVVAEVQRTDTGGSGGAGDGEAEPRFYEKPGQKFVQESPGAAARVFYETLYEQKPTSKMALVYCIEHGVFSKEKAKSLMAKYERAKVELRDQQKRATAAAAVKRAAESSGGTAKKTRVVEVSVSAADVGLSVGGAEGIGTMTM